MALTDTAAEAGALSRHAKERVFERTRLTPREVQRMLDQRQYAWAMKPKVNEDRYALVFDIVAKEYVVAVVAAVNQAIKTVLTLEQFEQSVAPVSDAVKLLSRMAQANPESGMRWRFVVRKTSGYTRALPVLDEEQLQAMGVNPKHRVSAEVKKEATRLINTAAFLSWFADALTEKEIPFELVRSVRLDVLAPNSDRWFEVGVTDAFVAALTGSAECEDKRAA